MPIYKDIKECEVIPNGYGISWRYYNKLITRCYLIPLNLIVRLFIIIYYWIRFGSSKTKWEKELYNAYYKGFKEGKNRGENENKS